jgi:hypothetical protein
VRSSFPIASLDVKLRALVRVSSPALLDRVC